MSNNLISTRASADIEIRGTGFEPVVTGNVTTDEGRIRLGQFSQLKVQNANVQFVESEPLNPHQWVTRQPKG